VVMGAVAVEAAREKATTRAAMSAP
jgi:hypothetical protein